MTFGLPLEPPDVPTDPSALGSLLDTAAAQVASHKGQAGSGAAFDNEQARSITARLRFRKTLLQVCSSGLQEWISQPAVHTLSLSLFWDVCFGTSVLGRVWTVRFTDVCTSTHLHVHVYTSPKNTTTIFTGVACAVFAAHAVRPGSRQEAPQRRRHADGCRTRLLCSSGWGGL